MPILMNSDFQRGVKIGLSIYGIGIVLTIIVHLIFGWDYPHGPPTSAIPLFLTLVVGGLRLLSTALMTMAERSQKAKGELIVHISVGVIILVFLA
jgi:hypothetical protein